MRGVGGARARGEFFCLQSATRNSKGGPSRNSILLSCTCGWMEVERGRFPAHGGGGGVGWCVWHGDRTAARRGGVRAWRSSPQLWRLRRGNFRGEPCPVEEGAVDARHHLARGARAPA